ncbi:23S rRNA (uracil(1939)-C(5))-methyltransferase RlmD [Marinobacter daepoensis]|uniref:23S rRNA (uracil(1939)-C(5))-methyltransferase RlmD n=1 Tax=Marinobacter daepoensis TaxID=262077 RepID=A0ABS3BJ92_9GAMM|nr:23S rRNA (uracil(1939)-C(5))-methyltransferase RlmD [Marinobacter daepoensis]MBN7771415.1 23S rRNA (uracil(1939)-C(5))-methyltransferase RlmD [Marinobacter daepoensis]MBY6034314.1 23S rRNA (uracil(1939)-C(5))-methyltransferase RlmD [Marinobacter daepoensis]MBY6080016.1 23S rRNA (uracil(1939)-C(5))-methyltransferase RlmD [Marinobacter daepoensis]
MSKRRRKVLPKEPVRCEIETLSHDGRGIARADGKTQFVDGALPGETVMAKMVSTRSRFDELRTTEVLDSAPDRQSPPCDFADLCGGCSLQHMSEDAQIRFKENTLREHFAHFGGIEPEQWVAPMRSPETLGYRRKARLGVRYVKARESVLVGFREKRNSFLTDIDRCAVLDPRIGERIQPLRTLLHSMAAFDRIAQVEVACGDDVAAMVFRNMDDLVPEDREKLIAFGQAHDLHIYLQPKGPDTVHRIWPESAGRDDERLSYRMDEFDLTLAFHPMDFTQVNAGINRSMVHRAVEWLDVQPGERVLDLFCGLGNFTLPLARKGGQVVGVEGDDAMVVRGRENARLNHLTNVEFHGADLHGDFTGQSWAKEGFDKILIDPPRSGAEEICKYLTAFGANRIVYVSCNPATLARDAGVMVRNGYRLVQAGVMDMFPHTTHVESIALFERDGD